MKDKIMSKALCDKKDQIMSKAPCDKKDQIMAGLLDNKQNILQQQIPDIYYIYGKLQQQIPSNIWYSSISHNNDDINKISSISPRKGWQDRFKKFVGSLTCWEPFPIQIPVWPYRCCSMPPALCPAPPRNSSPHGRLLEKNCVLQ
jgi:hypothetical protein